nr:MAG TPA: hypothetical protein [Caudoviricetes sp.]
MIFSLFSSVILAIFHPFFVKCYHGFEKRLRLVKTNFCKKYLFNTFILY